jgi:Flp pilus assembly protein TadG
MGMRSLKTHLQRFGREEEGGSFILETVIMLPLLLWALMSMIVYWDAYRSVNRLDKASYALADTLSRQQAPMPVTSVDQWDNLVTYMLDPGQTAQVRVTSYRWVPANNRFEVLWSRSVGGPRPAWTTDTLQTVASQIPIMDDTEYGILTETWVDYEPRLNVVFMDTVGVGPMTLTKFTPTPARFAPLCLVGMTATECTG